MQLFKRTAFIFALMLSLTTVYAGSCGSTGNRSCPKSCDTDVCCGQMGGISYCDSSAGRFVCSNGYYSSCYCTRHAVMDLQLLQGCCLWQGGVLSVTETGVVICNSGGISETCTMQSLSGKIGVY